MDEPRSTEAAPAPIAPNAREHVWATFCHLAALAVLVSFPWGLAVGPLVVWLIRKDDSSLVHHHGKAAVNFQLSVILYIIIAVLIDATFVGWQVRTIGYCLRLGPFPTRWPLRIDGWPALLQAWLPLFAAVVVLDVVCTIVAAVRANAGRPCRYPFAIPFIR
jgi:uncharacterized Tic20 family protein